VIINNSVKSFDIDLKKEITDLFDTKKIYLSSDWHLFNGEDDVEQIDELNKKTDKIIENYKETVTDDDVFIFLGDLITHTVLEKNDVIQYMEDLPGLKIFIRGNHDILDEDFYYKCGFTYVFDELLQDDALFTHIPKDPNQYMGAIYNFHGHQHFRKDYTVPYSNHLDMYVGAHDWSPVSLEEVQKRMDNGYYLPG
jgi:calcineurin-like phosphoesterase family protein